MRIRRLLHLLPKMFVDVIILFFAGFCASAMGYSMFGSVIKFKEFVFYFPILAVSCVLIFYFFGLYENLWQFAELRDVARIFFAVVVLVVSFYFGTSFWLRTLQQPKGFHLSFFVIELFLVVLFRILPRFRKWIVRVFGGYGKHGESILLIGAGEAAHVILSELGSSTRYEHSHVVGLIDDDPTKIGFRINGRRILGNREYIKEAVKKFSVDTIIFAISNCDEKDRQEILKICQSTGCKLQMMPTLIQKDEHFHITQIRNVEIEDLLGREPIHTDLHEIMGYVSGQSVLVTGGGGSIGSELCRQIAAYHPKKLTILDIYENTTYEIQLELKKRFPELDLEVRIGSVCDESTLETVFSDVKPDIIYHAAAHKHVPLMEDSPAEAIKNNVFGTRTLAMMADRHHVKRFVMISTDKAVNPTNVMGATKRMCEMIVQSFDKNSQTEFVAVRFGNVLGSNGSVIPLFKRQLAEGGPLTVTHKDIIRYFMTIPEAVSLVLQAGALAKGGEIFVLDMGDPVRITELAENLIRLSGFEPYKDIDIVFTGLRPGEKLYEELLMDEEGLSSTQNKLIHVGKPIEFSEQKFMKQLEALFAGLEGATPKQLRKEIQKIVPTYHPALND